MATQVLLAVSAMILVACDQAAPAPMTGDAVSAHSDTSNLGEADSPNNPDSEGANSTHGDDDSDLPPLNNCALLELELAPTYVTPSGEEITFSMLSIDDDCEVTIHDGGYAIDGRRVYGKKLPLSFKGTLAEMRLECLVHDEDTGQAIEIVIYSVFHDTGELAGDQKATAK